MWQVHRAVCRSATLQLHAKLAPFAATCTNVSYLIPDVHRQQWRRIACLVSTSCVMTEGGGSEMRKVSTRSRPCVLPLNRRSVDRPRRGGEIVLVLLIFCC
eukprot:858426-Pleurochrysis_carterae.AAC.2